MIGLVLAAAVAAQAAPPKACLAPGAAVEGEFRWVETRHPNGQSLRYPFVVLWESACVRDADGETTGRWVQLNFTDKKAAARLTPGQTVTVRADYGPPQTAWHIGDIIADQARLVPDARQ